LFVGQQFLQNVLGYSTLGAGAAILPAAFCMVLVAPRSAKITERRGTRFAIQLGQLIVLLGFLAMLLLWKEGIPYWKVALAYALIGIGVGLAGPPTSNTLTRSTPVRRVGMASGTADLQRDLGGAVMQSILGALLTAGYAAAFGAAITTSGKNVSSAVQEELTKSFSSAADLAEQYPQYSKQITAAARTSFLHGQHWAYGAGAIAVALALVLVFLRFPKKEQEHRMFASYDAESQAAPSEQATGARSADPGPGVLSP
jgi:MFS family permease